ncbi:hypothetical protein [Streptomyces sp. MA5143a]|uniref:hypothetical protein n=1 Tax=Streptomyces sp. MA5143a TaxID=2083010 RepID=UPI000D2C6C10|nr:hypothetical protein [Streptomyces sp. MA5143a]SPF05954.1 hypothetical protein SMA5143A_6774 [Streptomyces sp. MA5143a]
MSEKNGTITTYDHPPHRPSDTGAGIDGWRTSLTPTATPTRHPKIAGPPHL